MTSTGCRAGQPLPVGLWGQIGLDLKCSSVTHYGLASMSPFCKMGTQQCLPHRVGVRSSWAPQCKVPAPAHMLQLL